MDRCPAAPLRGKTRWNAPFALNYFAFIKARAQAGGRCERIRVGASDQISPIHGGRFPAFRVRNVCGNGVVWRGAGEETHSVVPRRPSKDACILAVMTQCHTVSGAAGSHFHEFA